MLQNTGSLQDITKSRAYIMTDRVKQMSTIPARLEPSGRMSSVPRTNRKKRHIENNHMAES